jgi:hypothetical protein
MGNLIKEYITGRYALNVHHPENLEEPTGDWHGSIWDAIKELPHKDVTYAGEGHEINTFKIWDDFGIFDDKKSFEKMSITVHSETAYIADFYRAVLDMLYRALIKYECPLNLNCATEDYFDTEKQKYLIIDHINMARKYFTPEANKSLDQWIDHEINYEKYRRIMQDDSNEAMREEHRK